MALLSVTDKISGTTFDVYDIKPVTVAGTETALFLVYDTALAVFAWQPASKFSTTGGGDIAIPVNDIIFDFLTYNVFIGTPGTINATIVPSNATDPALTWTSENEEIATVSASGNTATITGVSQGRTRIFAEATSGATREAFVNILPTRVPVTSVDILPDSLSLAVGDQASATVLVSPAGATNRGFTWDISPAGILTPLSSAANIGFFRADAEGTATITAISISDPDVKGTCTVTVGVQRSAEVGTYAQLVTALGNSSINKINVIGDIVMEDTITINRSMTFNGNNHEFSYTEDTFKDGIVISANDVVLTGVIVHLNNNDPAWEGHYGIQVYNSTGVIMSNLTSTGEDGGILINGSEVSLAGNINLDANQFGGIEVSRGTGATRDSILDVSDAQFSNDTESYGHPTMWIDGTGTINGTEAFTIIELNGQQQYYLHEENSIDPDA